MFLYKIGTFGSFALVHESNYDVFHDIMYSSKELIEYFVIISNNELTLINNEIVSLRLPIFIQINNIINQELYVEYY